MYKNYKEFLNERDNYLRETKGKSSGSKIVPADRKELYSLVKRDDVYLGDIVIPKHVTDLSDLFGFSERRDFSGLDKWDVSHVTNMRYMFERAWFLGEYSSNTADISNWDVSNVTDMEGMFNGCAKFSQPIGKWNVSKVTNMKYMFQDCRTFNHPLDKWDVSKVTNMRMMFEGCWHFNQPLKKWNLRSVKDASAMFMGAHNYKQDLSSWEKKYNFSPDYLHLEID